MAGPNDPPQAAGAPGGPAPDPPKNEPQGPPPVGISTPGAGQAQPGHYSNDLQAGVAAGGGAPAQGVSNQQYNRGLFAAGPVSGSVTISQGTAGRGVGAQQTAVLASGDTAQFSLFTTQQYTLNPTGQHQGTFGLGAEGDMGGNNPNRPRLQLGAYGSVGNVPGQGGVAVNGSAVALLNVGTYDVHLNPPNTLGLEARYAGVIQRDGAGHTVADHNVTGALSYNHNWTIGDGSTVVRAGVSVYAGVDRNSLPGGSGDTHVMGAMAGLGGSFGGSPTRPRDEGRVYQYEMGGRTAPRHGPFDVEGRVSNYDPENDRVTIGEGRTATTLRVSELMRNTDADSPAMRDAFAQGKNVSITVMSDGYNHMHVNQERERAVATPARGQEPGGR